MPEFPRHVLEVLREPLETGRITLSRAARTVDYPARFQLVAAMNPCPCGDFGHPIRACRCGPDAIARYQGRISGPLLDRIDVRVEVPFVDAATLAGMTVGEDSATVAARIVAAHDRQRARQGCVNAALEGTALERHARPDPAGARLLETTMRRLAWSARAYHRVLRIARTAADLEDSEGIGAPHVAEAIGLRRAPFERPA